MQSVQATIAERTCRVQESIRLRSTDDGTDQHYSLREPMNIYINDSPVRNLSGLDQFLRLEVEPVLFKTNYRAVSRRLPSITISLTLSLLAALPADAFAWGNHGHRIVARIAANYLNSKAASAVDELLRTDPYLKQKCPQDTSIELRLACIASWPDPPVKDERPYTANWHFVDIPVSMSGGIPARLSAYDAARDCAMSSRGDCAILALDRLQYVLANSKEEAISRAEALKFIVHIVGDLHQPLHSVTDKKDFDDPKDLGDLGGNSKVVQWLGMDTSPRWAGYHWNLHLVWDEGIIDNTLALLKTDEDGYLKKLLSTLPPRESNRLAMYQTGNAVAWAEEAYMQAVLHVYASLPPPDKTYKYSTREGKEASGGYILDSSYYEANAEIVDAQLRKGGLRLAKLLNDLLGK